VKLCWVATSAGITFSIEGRATASPVEEWNSLALTLSSGANARVGTLSRFADEELLQKDPEGWPVLPHEQVSRLTVKEAAGLGLSPVLTCLLSIDSVGLLPQSTFKFRYGLYIRQQDPSLQYDRIGAVVSFAGREAILPYPIYQLVDGMDAVNNGPPSSPQERMAAWGRLQQLLPEDAKVSATLKQIKIVSAGSFQINPFIDEAGEPNFNPVIGEIETRNDELLEGDRREVEFQPLLSEERTADFQRYFRQSKSVGSSYPVGAGTYVLLSPELQKTLQIVRDKQSASSSERKAFLAAPHGTITETLGAVSEKIDLERVLWDSGYSERVEGVGIWAPKILPWLKPSAKQKWIPEQVGVKVGEKFIQVDPKDIEGLKKKVRDAIAEGAAAVEFDGQKIPANKDALDVLEKLVGLASPEQTEKSDDKPEKSEKKVLVVTENFEVVDYQGSSRKGRPSGSAKLPACVDANLLLPHQDSAFEWLKRHWTSGSLGALLADDMGLGKTLEALVFLAWIKDCMEQGIIPVKPLLIIAPTGLLRNWVDEHEKHLDSPGLGSLLQAYGSKLKELRHPNAMPGQELVAGGPVLNIDAIAGADWVVTTYETWRDYQHSFCLVDWGVVVMDEAQKIKNPAAAVTDAIKAMKAEFCLALTGTPVENRVSDLWSIVDAVQPGRLGPLKEFARRYDSVGGQSLKQLHATLTESKPEIILRRLKGDHLDGLPDREVRHVEYDMPDSQAAAYADVINSAKMSAGKKGEMLKTLHAMRNISLHPGIEPASSDELIIADSARLQALFGILDKVRDANEKALVFIESREMQGQLVDMLVRRYSLKLAPMVINGSVSGETRKYRVDVFQKREGFDVMLLSPKAGGVGLTLTSANHVIHLSRWWNPAVEDQCSDRVFRIGQQKKVYVYYLMATHPQFGENSFDVQLDKLLSRKRELSREVLAPTMIDPDEVGELFRSTVGGVGLAEEELARIDQLEPIAFENWVLDRFRDQGFSVSRTPVTGDFGADGVAVPPEGSGKPTYIIQCKHSGNSGNLCGPEGVSEVVRSIDHYPSEGSVVGVLVTNSAKFSGPAKETAAANNVRLVGRSSLGSLGQWRSTSREDGKP